MEIQMNKRTADYIADQLADQILSGAIRGGTPLKQEELSGLLGASRIPVREALQIIEHQGLAVRLATRHVVTADFSDAHIREIYGIIGDIERRVLCDLVSTYRKGRYFYYVPVVPLEEYQKRECEKMLQRLFLGDCSKMRSCLAQVEREALKV